MRAVSHIERALYAVAFLCVAYCVFVGLRAREFDVSAKQIVGSPVSSDTPASSVSSDLFGRIDIPALSLSAPFSSDYDADSLRKGVGHVRGTAMPGGLGTVGLVGHRDSFFRPLRKIATGMDIRLTDSSGTYHYAVDSTEVVTPDKVEVLATGQRPELTLVTCFPFDYVGAAPRRFIVHAHLLSASPDAVTPVR
ncbi:class D sortase [Granulicella sp. L60]|uniref:class D sortase n=1 Tax=Granulicella sp. L60 TaxID=1641866 RepID=UPI00131BCFA9|nr:class D sortase [Granulicella sp. L60]